MVWNTLSFSYVIAPQRALQKKISPFLINIALTLTTQCFYHKIGIMEENFISAGPTDGNQPNLRWPNTVFWTSKHTQELRETNMALILYGIKLLIFFSQSLRRGFYKSRQPAKFAIYIKQIDLNSLPTFEIYKIRVKLNFH